MLRVHTDELFSRNLPELPQFCRFNSGAARKQEGQAVPRGPDTFSYGALFSGTRGDIKEVTYRDKALMPAFESGTIDDKGWKLI